MKYRKKPVIVNAYQMTRKHMGNRDGWPLWLVEAWATNVLYVFGEMKIRTLEGDHTVTPDDFIIQGVHGELYPCKPDIFRETYEEVGDTK